MTKYGHDSVVPFEDSGLGKKEQVGLMFDKIAMRYDFLNKLLSAGMDKHWRDLAIRELREINPSKILDVATGTAEMIISMAQRLSTAELTGIDISEGMLAIARKKVHTLKNVNNIRLETGDSEALHYPDSYFDAITVAFGVRNFENLEKGLNEMLRVLRSGGKLVILEFSQPGNSRFRMFCKFYISRIAPFLVQLFSKKQAYQYLDKSIQAFPEGKNFIQIMDKLGFSRTYQKPLSFGICSIYCGYKP
jgi:demethylmenaquinone methyltransferase / 2-methoxy-6-polyprenyl-1,4-benzoquinol methylase